MTNKNTKLVTLRVPVTIECQASAEGEKQGPPTFSALAYSGGMIPGYTMTPPVREGYIFDLEGMSEARNVVANLGHDSDKLVGHATTITNDKKTVTIAGVLSAVTPYQDEVAASAANGFPWEVSIEASGRGLKKIAAGKSAVVNGQTFDGPLYVVAKSKLTGIAFVAMGADDGNNVTIAASAAGENAMTEFDKFCASLGADPETITDDNRSNLQLAFDATKKNGKTPSADLLSFEEMAEAERAETKRRDEIKRMTLEAVRLNRPMQDQIFAFGQEAIESGMNITEFELKLLRSTRTIKGTFGVGNIPQNDPLVIEASLAMAVGLPNVEKHYKPEALEAAERGGMRQFSLQELMMTVACANGYNSRTSRVNTGNLKEVLEYCFPPATMRLEGFSTISLPGILGSVAYKEILAGYMEEDQSWREISNVKSVSNFHAVTSYRMLDSLEYEEVGPAGEIKHGTLGQESYTRQAKTYAKMLGLTRQDIINDDLGAFDDIRARLGRGAAKAFNNIFWAEFMLQDSGAGAGTFFTAALSNYISGSTTNLGIDGVGLELGVAAYRKMTTASADGTKRIGANLTRPSILLVPPELEFIAQKLYQSANVNTGGSSSATSVPNANIHQNLYRPIVQNRLSDSAFTGYSTIVWYLLGNDYKPMVVSFLNGQATPTIESAEADFDTLGIQFRGVHDFGCDLAEYLCGIKSKGGS